MPQDQEDAAVPVVTLGDGLPRPSTAPWSKTQLRSLGGEERAQEPCILRLLALEAGRGAVSVVVVVPPRLRVCCPVVGQERISELERQRD